MHTHLVEGEALTSNQWLSTRGSLSGAPVSSSSTSSYQAEKRDGSGVLLVPLQENNAPEGQKHDLGHSAHLGDKTK